jgi:hypothetical protein
LAHTTTNYHIIIFFARQKIKKGLPKQSVGTTLKATVAGNRHAIKQGSCTNNKNTITKLKFWRTVKQPSKTVGC